MLRGKLTLHDIHDTEALCARVIERAKLKQTHHEYEDCLTFLVETAWELSIDFCSGEASFSTYAYAKLRQRLVDWQRGGGKRTRWQFADRTYERTLPTFVSYERQFATQHTFTGSHKVAGDSESGELARIIAEQYCDPADDRSPDLMRVLGKRSGRAAGPDAPLGEAPARRAA